MKGAGLATARAQGLALGLTLGLFLQPTSAQAVSLLETEQTSLDLGGDVKTFTTLTLPYKHPILFPSTDPQGSGALDLRAKLVLTLGEHFKFTLHPTFSAISSGAGNGLPGLGSATTAGGTPEAVTLSKRWPSATSSASPAAEQLRLGMDRLVLEAATDWALIKLGRQPVSFGTTFFFSPMDLVSPFTATTLDREYKPGVDALRTELYLSETGTLNLVAAYAGSWDLDGMVFVAHGGVTLDVWDLGAFAGLVHKDLVLGLDTQGSIGSVGVRAEGTLTRPAEGGKLFGRVDVGADHHFEAGLDLSGELYVQTNGAAESADYQAQLLSPRVIRGEQWTLGQVYLALTLGGDLSPIFHVSVFALANLRDPSALIGPALSWSISEELSLDAGLYLGLGEKPASALQGLSLDLGSEFGLMPATSFVVLKAYL